MKKTLPFFMFVGALILLSLVTTGFVQKKVTGAPPYGAPEEEAPDTLGGYLKDWIRPDGPPRVGIQIGHLDSSSLPDELDRIRGNTGASGGGVTEAEVNAGIAREIQKILEAEGVEVDILPATIPPRYWTDIFISIHADGSLESDKSGYKFAAPWRDFTGKADDLVVLLEKEYEPATGLTRDPNITRNMRGYYAFAWWRYEHAIHPMTTGVIAETGFLSNYSDRQLLINSPEVPALAIAKALLKHLENEGLL